MSKARVSPFNEHFYSAKGPEVSSSAGTHPAFLIQKDHINGPRGLDGNPAFIIPLNTLHTTEMNSSYFNSLKKIRPMLERLNPQLDNKKLPKIKIYYASKEEQYKDYQGPIAVLIPELHPNTAISDYTQSLIPYTAQQMRQSNQSLLSSIFSGALGVNDFLYEGSFPPELALFGESTWTPVVAKHPEIRLHPGEIRANRIKSSLLFFLQTTALLQDLNATPTEQSDLTKSLIRDVGQSHNSADVYDKAKEILIKELLDIAHSLVNEYLDPQSKLFNGVEASELQPIIRSIISDLNIGAWVEHSNWLTAADYTIPFALPRFTEAFAGLPKEKKDLFFDYILSAVMLYSKDRDRDICKKFQSINIGPVPMIIGVKHITNLVFNGLEDLGIPVIVLGCEDINSQLIDMSEINRPIVKNERVELERRLTSLIEQFKRS